MEIMRYGRIFSIKSMTDNSITIDADCSKDFQLQQEGFYMVPNQLHTSHAGCKDYKYKYPVKCQAI